MLPKVSQSPRQSLWEDESTTAWVAVMEGIVLLRAFLDVKIILLLIENHDNVLGFVLGGGRLDDLLGAIVNDGLGHLLDEETTSGLKNVVHSKGTPPGILGVTTAGGVMVGHVVGGALGSDHVAGCRTLQYR